MTKKKIDAKSPFAALGKLKSELEAQAKSEREAAEAKRVAEAERRAAIGLERLKPAPKNAEAEAAKKLALKKPATVDVWRPENLDRDLFNVAMGGVKPLAHKKPGRILGEIAAEKGRSAGAVHRRAAAEGDDALDVRWSDDGTCEGSRKGRSFALEALARFANPEDTLDLHGLDEAAAHARVAEFVRSRRARGMRVVAIVHGAGKHAPDGRSVLCDVTVKALSSAPSSREVDAFRSEERAVGPASRLFVALRAKG